ncbi:MAG: serine hydrolase [Candidatus Thermoplasmatota archaeon]|nr:serine hydrolase [Candidatus Thermoplasmatota archaeon]
MNKKYLVLSTLFIVFLLFISTVNTVANSNPQENNTDTFKEQQFRLEQIDVPIKILMKLSKVPSISACVIKDDRIIWSNAYGYQNIEEKKEAQDTTLYNIASISKTITATALMQLYEQGFFDLDDDINTFLPFSVRHPEYADVPITFRMLLAHQSGLSEDPLKFYTYFPLDECPIPLYPWIETYLSPVGNNYTHQIWSSDAPGEVFHYANVGFALIGYLVERISGQPFYQYCHESIFLPLKMYNTSYLLQDLDLLNVAMPYRHLSAFYVPFGYHCYLGYPCGSVHTSVIELSQFIIAHMNNGVYDGYQLLNASTVSLMHTIQYPNSSYGLGWVVVDDIDTGLMYGHTGGDTGVATNVVVQEDDDTAIIYFTNGHPRGFIQVFAWSLFQNILFSLV